MSDSMKTRNAAAAEIDRLARIWYEGWQDAHARHRKGTMVIPLETSAGTFRLEVWRYEKPLSPGKAQ